MPDALIPGIAAILAAIAGIVGYFFRGRIGGSTADKLWDVTEKLRTEQALEIRELKQENRDLNKRLTDVEKVAETCQGLAALLEKSNERLQRESERKDDYISRLLSDNQALIKENAALKKLG